MTTDQKRNMPASLRPLLEEIETHAGREAYLRRNSAIRGQCRGRAWLEGLDIQPNGDALALQPVIEYPDSTIGPDTMCHELLHLRRALIDQVPIVVINNLAGLVGTGSMAAEKTSWEQVTNHLMLDSQIEHIFIYRQMRDYGFLEQRAAKNWIADAVQKPPSLNREISLLCCWLQISLSIPELRPRATDALIKAGRLGEARRLEAAVRPLLGNKTALSACIGTAVGLRLENLATVETYRTEHGTWRRVLKPMAA